MVVVSLIVAMAYPDTTTTHVSRPRIINPSSVFKQRPLKIGSAGCSGKISKPYPQPNPCGFVSL